MNHSIAVQTLVFFDLETTGLLYTQPKTKITELSLVAVQREHILTGCVPRVQNKLNLCINPQVMIDPVASDVTGLSNFDLEQQSVFNIECYEIIYNFLNRLKKPICLIAHNGNKFDYPILRKELDFIGATLPDGILCVDSLPAFRSLLSNKPTQMEADSIMLPELQMHDEMDSILTEVAENIENEYFKENISEEDRIARIQKINETTPKKKTESKCPSIKKHTPITEITHSASRGKRKLNFTGTKYNGRKPEGLENYKLVSIYEYLSGVEAKESHKADADVNLLLECAVILGDIFLKWIDSNAVNFN